MLREALVNFDVSPKIIYVTFSSPRAHVHFCVLVYSFTLINNPIYHNAKGNGRAEAAVKVAKAMLKKSEDFQLALLLYRNTPPGGHTYFPSQRMLCRRT